MQASLCLPTCNGEAFIAEALRSVLTQSWRDFEILVVDDQSTDATLDIVRSFADPRLQVLQNPRRLGIPGNWNRCLDLARGDYVCLFHQDDVMLPENLGEKVQMLESDPTIGLVHSAVDLIQDASAPSTLSSWIEDAPNDFTVDGDWYFRKLLFQGNVICASAVVARRQKLLDRGGFDEGLGFACDYELWMKMCVQNRVAFLSEPLVGYRWHEKNASHAYRFEQGAEECLVASRRALQYYRERTGCLEKAEILAEVLVPLAELRRWATQLDRGRAWLEEQSQNWQKIAEERERVIKEQSAWIEELEQGKAWLEAQRASWQKIAEDREGAAASANSAAVKADGFK